MPASAIGFILRKLYHSLQSDQPVFLLWLSEYPSKLRKFDHRYRGNGAVVIGAQRTACLKLLRLADFYSIREATYPLQT